MDEFSPYGSDEEQGYEESALDKVKQYLPQAIGIIVLILIAYFAYNYFIGSNADVTISVKDSQGKPISANLVKIYSSDNKEVFKGANKAGYATTLKVGEYKITVSSSDYPLYSDILTVDQENSSFDIVLKKQYKLELGIMVKNNKLIKGIENEIEVTITNNGNEDVTITSIDVNSIEGITFESQKDIVILAGNQTKSKVIAKIAPSLTLKADQKNTGISLTAKIA